MRVSDQQFEDAQRSLTELVDGVKPQVKDIKLHIDTIVAASMEGFVEVYKTDPDRAIKEMGDTLRECLTAAIAVSIIQGVMETI